MNSISHTEQSRPDDRYRLFAALVSLVVSLTLMLLKFWAHNLTHSQAVFSDALESVVNVIAAGMALLVVYYGAKPADQDHPYGHGKVEYFSAAFEGGLIAFAAVTIMASAVRTLIVGSELRDLGLGLYVVAVAGMGNLLLGLWLIRVGKKRHSVALRASGHHVITDFWTSVGLIGGLLILQFTGIKWLDSALAMAVSAYFVFTGVRLVRDSVSGLMDAEDLSVLKALADVFSMHAQDGIIQIHHVKVIRSGWFHHIDAHIVVPEFWNVKQTHDRVTEFEQKVIKSYEYEGEMNFHLDPCRQAYCKNCNLENCPIRKENFETRLPMKINQLRSPVEPEEFRRRRRS
jgi:cation diffusion facilitator family transporter